MSKPTDPGSSTPGSRAPTSGRKHIDPTRYQMDTVPAELVAKIAQMKIESLPKSALKPPPLFDKRPIVGRLRRLGVWTSRRKTALSIGCFVGLCAVATMSIWRWGTKTDVRIEEVRAVERSAAGLPSSPRTPNVDTPRLATPEKPPTTPKTAASTGRTELPPATSIPKRAATKSAKTSGPPNNTTDVMDTPFVRGKPKSASQ